MDALAAIDELIEETVVGDPQAEREYLRSKWIGEIILQLVVHRDQAGLTQQQLGERLGKAQSAIARLERGSDLKLSVVFDHLFACGVVPTGQVPVKSLKSARKELIAPPGHQANPGHSTPATDHQQGVTPQWHGPREQGNELPSSDAPHTEPKHGRRKVKAA
jgi:transcriptional regulator with XRE-family HTH domain